MYYMNIYYINLNRSLNRKKYMEETYNNINRIEAYDGNDLNQYKDIVLPTKTNSSIYELACSFSHIKAIISAYNNNEDEVLIMEDDTRNDYKSKWVKSIEEIIKMVERRIENDVRNYPSLLDKFRSINFHIHDISIADILLSDSKEIFYICSNCPIQL